MLRCDSVCSAVRQVASARKLVRTVVVAGGRGHALRVPTPAGGAPEVPVEVRMRFLQIADDLEIDALDLREIDLLDMASAC